LSSYSPGAGTGSTPAAGDGAAVPDLDWIRSQFPAFGEPSLEGFCHFENAGGSYACRQVIEALRRYYTCTKVQPYYDFAPSRAAGLAMDQARQRLAAWMNVAPEEVQLGTSTTQHAYVLGQAFREHLSPGDEVIVTNQDHEANIGAWRRLADAGITVREWRVDPDTAELDSAELDRLLNDKTKLVAFTHCSNIVGSINPVREWCDKARAAGAVSVVDGVSYAPHGIPDVQALGCDVYLFSLYKVYGPHQGVMYLNRELNQRLPHQAHFFNARKPHARFLPSGPDHAQIAAVNGLMDYLQAFYERHADPAHQPARTGAVFQRAAVNDLMHAAERANLEPLLAFLRERPGLRIIGKQDVEGRAPTVALRLDKQSPHELAASLAERNIGIANGNCYAWRLMEALDIPPEDGVARISLVHYTSPAELQRLLEALDELL
jgi:cysteine desulfurase family protein (TIGR01976 family)